MRMNKLLTAFAVVATLVGTMLVRPVLAQVDVDIHIGVPVPPVVVFHSEPEVVVVPRTSVYYVPAVTEYDMYRFGPYWYINRDGYWYRAKAYRGPFNGVEYNHVPREIVVVPSEYRHHPRHPRGGPPGHRKHKGHGNHGDDDD
jgi:hypothetical protein